MLISNGFDIRKKKEWKLYVRKS